MKLLVTYEMEIDERDIERIFGKVGSDAPGTLRIGNGFIKDYRDHILALSKASDVHPSHVSDLFCSTRGQTAIEDERAKDKSLRFTRVDLQFANN